MGVGRTKEWRVALGQRLRQAMASQGFDGVKLAETVGTTKQHVSQWCRGLVPPSVEQMVVISDVLNVPFEWLATGRTTSNLPEAQYALVKTYLEKMPKKLPFIISLLETMSKEEPSKL